MKKIILASASPRRKKLLEHLGIKFSVDVSHYKENMAIKLKPQKLAEYLSFQKAKTVAPKYKDEIIIAADTFVVFENEIMGKAHTKEEAKIMLKKLSGKVHLVITGFTVVDTKTNNTITKSETTKVFFRNLTEKEIDHYIATGEPIGKAGAYAIQDFGSLFIEKIEGDYFNVVGLPLCSLSKILKEFDVSIL